MPPSVCGLIACIQDLTIENSYPCFKTVDLEASSVSVSIRGFVAHLSIDLTYVNGFNQPVEVTYTCPVDARAAIYHFEAQLDGRNITGQCLERKKAENLYKDAVKQGHTAIIAAEDKCSSDVLHLTLGNLGKGEKAKLRLKMVQELSVGIDGSVTFTLPTVFNPRYSPADQKEAGNQSVYSNAGSVLQLQSRLYSMQVEAEVVGSNKIDKISSQSDPINFTMGDGDSTAKISQIGEFKCDHDWSIQIHYQSPYHPHLLRETGDRSSTGMMTDDLVTLNFFPEMPVDAFSPHNEIIFLVDRSGSMEGDRIEKSKSALLLFLKSLPHGCRFNIISFGNTYSSLFASGSERYSEGTLKAALELQKSMGADMGGTEILEAFKFIYSKAPTPGYARKILVLTDGEVWNVDQILELVNRQSKETQVFSVGIGDGVSTALIQGLAKAGRGRHEIVMDTNILQMKVMGLIASMLQDHVRDLSIKFEADPPQKITLIPDLPPMIFGGQHLIVYARVPPNVAIKSISLSGKVGDKDLTFTVEEKDCKTVHDGQLSLHRMAAKSQINSWQVNHSEGINDEMIALSIASGVVCSKTAIVGVDHEGKVLKEKEEPENVFGFNSLGGALMGPQALTCGISNFRTRCSRSVPLKARGGFVSFQSAIPFSPPLPPSGHTFGSAISSTSACPPPSGHTFGSVFSSTSAFPSPSGQTFGSAFSSTSAFPSPSGHTFGSAFSSSSSGPPPGHTFRFGAASDTECPKVVREQLCESALLTRPTSTPSSLFGSVRKTQFEPAPTEEAAFKDELLEIVAAQNFDGSWSLDSCWKLLNLINEEIITSMKSIQNEFNLDGVCFATVICLTLLNVRFPSRKPEWNLIAIKGNMFLQSKGCSTGNQVVEKLTEVIS